MQKKRIPPQDLALMALLLALQIVLSRFCSIQVPGVKIGFAFIPTVMAARRYGIFGAATVAGLADFLGALLFPSGAYHPGFTVSAIIGGAFWGWLVYRKVTLPRVLAAALANKVVVTLLLNTLWLSQILDKGYLLLLPDRVFQAVVMTIFETLLTMLLLRHPTIDKLLKQKF